MYLSLWILMDKIAEEYQTTSYIQNGEMCIRNASFLFDNNALRVNDHTVYVCRSEEVIPTMPGQILCVNRWDYFFIAHDNLEEIFEMVQNIIDDYLEWDLNVRDRVDEKCSLQDLMEMAEPFLRTMVSVMDSGYIIQGVAGMEDAPGFHEKDRLEFVQNKPVPVDHVAEYNDIIRSHINEKSPYLFREPILKAWFLVQNIYFYGWFSGFCIAAVENEEVPTAKRQLFEVLCLQVHRWFEHNHSIPRISGQHALFLKILQEDPSMDRNAVRLLFDELQWFQEDEKYLVKVKDMTGNTLIYEHLIRQITQVFSYCYVLDYQGSIILAINAARLNLSNLLEQLKYMFRKLDVVFGISFPFHDIFSMPQALKQASIAMDFAIAHNRKTAWCEESTLEYVKQVLSEKLTADVEEPFLKNLRRYDKQHGTEYYQTLYVFLQQERSPKRASETLHIHKNTLLYRIKKIEETGAVDLDSAACRQKLMLSYYIYGDQI